MKDLLTYLFDKYYLESTDAASMFEQNNDIAMFVDWSRDFLTKVNPPVNITYLKNGFGLKLRNGDDISITVQDDTDSNVADMVDAGAVGIFKANDKGHNMLDDRSVGIFKTNK